MAEPLQDAPHQLHTVEVDQPLAAVNRLLAGLHLALAATAISHRGVHDIMLAADLVLLFLWLLSQAPMLRPVSRAAFPGRLSHPALPGVDVMMVTADPDKEPAVKVMNTVISAMALDYPGGRLTVYLSDDAGSPLTLLAARKAYAFARVWVPFCRKYGVQCPCPERFFASNDQLDGGGGVDHHHELADDKIRVKNMYETFKKGVEEATHDAALSQSWTKAARQDHGAHVEIIADKQDSSVSNSDDEDAMPSLVYVSREKRPAWAHHFKAGALNVLVTPCVEPGEQRAVRAGAGLRHVLQHPELRPGGHVLPPPPPPPCRRPRLRAVPPEVPQPQQQRHLRQRAQIHLLDAVERVGRPSGPDPLRHRLLPQARRRLRCPPVQLSRSSVLVHGGRRAEDEVRPLERSRGVAAPNGREHDDFTRWPSPRGRKVGGVVRVRDGHQMGRRGWFPVPVGGGGLLHRLPAALLPRVDVRLLLPGALEAGAVPRQRAHQPQRRAGAEQALDVRHARRRPLQALSPGLLPRRLPAPQHGLRLLRLHGPLRLRRALLRHRAAAQLLPRRHVVVPRGLEPLVRRRVRVVAAAAPDRSVGGQARAGGQDVVERAEVLGAQRRHGPAIRLPQRRPGPGRRRRAGGGLRPHEQGVRQCQAVPRRRVRFRRVLDGAPAGHHALPSKRRGPRRRGLEDGDQRQQGPRVRRAFPPLLRRGSELSAASRHVPAAGPCKSSRVDHGHVRRHGCYSAFLVWLSRFQMCFWVFHEAGVSVRCSWLVVGDDAVPLSGGTVVSQMEYVPVLLAIS